MDRHFEGGRDLLLSWVSGWSEPRGHFGNHESFVSVIDDSGDPRDWYGTCLDPFIYERLSKIQVCDRGGGSGDGG